MNFQLHITARRAATIVLSALALAAVVPSSASATKPVGECTQSYAPVTLDEFLAIFPPDAPADVLTGQFDTTDQNGDSVICFKYYSGGPHRSIYLGNAIDDMAAPHS